MSSASDSLQADEARSALISDIQDLKQAGHRISHEVNSALPWIVGGALGLLAITSAIALKPKRRSFGPSRPSLIGRAARAAALSAIGLLARRLALRAADRALPATSAQALRDARLTAQTRQTG